MSIISPSSTKIDRRVKFKQYQNAGVQFYWIVDPAQRTIEAYRAIDEKYVAAGKGKASNVVNLPPFEDLDIPLARLWHPLTKRRA
jgi:Uma2 family endonuclease